MAYSRWVICTGGGITHKGVGNYKDWCATLRLLVLKEQGLGTVTMGDRTIWRDLPVVGYHTGRREWNKNLILLFFLPPLVACSPLLEDWLTQAACKLVLQLVYCLPCTYRERRAADPELRAEIDQHQA